MEEEQKKQASKPKIFPEITDLQSYRRDKKNAEANKVSTVIKKCSVSIGNSHNSKMVKRSKKILLKQKVYNVNYRIIERILLKESEKQPCEPL